MADEEVETVKPYAVEVTGIHVVCDCGGGMFDFDETEIDNGGVSDEFRFVKCPECGQVLDCGATTFTPEDNDD